MLVSGIAVLIAMAGMFLSGDKTFMSFSVGTMIVVFVAMVGSLTVLPAVLGRLGDKVEKGRIPFIGRRRKQRDSRVWGAILDRVLRHPARLGRRRRCGARRHGDPDPGPAHDPDRHRRDHHRRGRAVRAADGGLPRCPEPAVVAIEAEDVKSPAVRDAVGELKREALASGEMNAPIEIETNRDGTVTKVEIPLAGNGTDDASSGALATLRDDLLPQTLGKVDGVDYAVAGQTAYSQDFNG